MDFISDLLLSTAPRSARWEDEDHRDNNLDALREDFNRSCCSPVVEQKEKNQTIPIKVKETYTAINYPTPSEAVKRLIEMLQETIKGDFCTDMLQSPSKWKVSCVVEFEEIE